MSNIMYKSVFVLLTITCHYAVGDTECTHYYIPMMEDTMTPANSSTFNLDDFISDIGVSRNCVVIFNCFEIQHAQCERPLDIIPIIGKTEFKGSKEIVKPIKTNALLTTTILTTENEEASTTIIYSTTEENGELLATTPLLTSIKEEDITTSLLPTCKNEDDLATTLLPTNKNEDDLATTLLPTSTKKEEMATTPSPTSRKEEELGKTSNPTAVDDEQLTTTFPETSERQPVNNSIDLEDKYLIKMGDNCIMNVSVFIKKNGCKVNTDDGENGTLIYDCENLLIDDYNESQGLKDRLDIDKLNERNRTNCPIIIKETASDTDFILQLNYDTGKGTFSKNGKNPFNLTVVCNNDTHSKCDSIKFNSIMRSKKVLYTASNSTLNNNSIELMKLLNGSENYKCEPLSTTSILQYSDGLSPTNTPNVATTNIKFVTPITTIINEGNTLTKPKESTIVNNEISTTGYKEKNNIHVTSSSTTVTEATSPESTLNHTVTTTVDVGTTFRTTLNDVSTERSELKSTNNQEDMILPVALVSLGSLAAAILIWMAIRKCIDLKKSGQYSLPEPVEMNAGFTDC